MAIVPLLQTYAALHSCRPISLDRNFSFRELLILGPVLLVLDACGNNLVLSGDMSGLFVVVMIFVAVWAAVMNGTRAMGRTIAQLGCRDVETSDDLPYVVLPENPQPRL
jgi:hypothetical protein